MKSFKQFCLGLVLISCHTLLFAQSAETSFEKGNQAYASGNYTVAVKNYEQALSKLDAPSDALYYNLGNAYYKCNDLAKAVLYFEKALKLNPTFEQAEENLAVVNAKLIDQIEPAAKQQFTKLWTSFKLAIGANNFGLSALVFLLISALFFTLLLKTNTISWRKTSFFIGVFTLLISLLSLAMSISTYRDHYLQHFAILTSEKVDVKTEPKDKANNAFVLHEGCKMEIINELNSWYEIVLSNGNTGWIPKKTCAEI